MQKDPFPELGNRHDMLQLFMYPFVPGAQDDYKMGDKFT